MITKTEHKPDADIESRLPAERAEASALRAEAAKLADDQRLTPEAVVKKRSAVQARIDEKELLISELERRLPAEVRDKLADALRLAIGSEHCLDDAVQESLLRVRAAEEALQDLCRQHDSLLRERDRKHGRVFSLRRDIERHQQQHPEVYADA